MSRIIEIIVRPQAVNEEYDRAAFYLSKLAVYTQKGYTDIALPAHPFFQELTKLGADLSVLETSEAREIFRKEVYNPDTYTAKLHEIESDRPTIERGYEKFEELHAQWDFVVFPRYEIAVTAYGTYGSFDEETGRIVMSTTSKRSPRRVALHEGVHIGIEKNIAEPYELEHWERERLVDQMCVHLFQEELPGYELQPNGDPRIDPYITHDSLKNLPVAVQKYVTDFPR